MGESLPRIPHETLDPLPFPCLARRPGLAPAMGGPRRRLASRPAPSHLRHRRREQRGGSRAAAAPLRGGRRPAHGARSARDRSLRSGRRAGAPASHARGGRRGARRRRQQGPRGRRPRRAGRGRLLLLRPRPLDGHQPRRRRASADDPPRTPDRAARRADHRRARRVPERRLRAREGRRAGRRLHLQLRLTAPAEGPGHHGLEQPPGAEPGIRRAERLVLHAPPGERAARSGRRRRRREGLAERSLPVRVSQHPRVDGTDAGGRAARDARDRSGRARGRRHDVSSRCAGAARAARAARGARARPTPAERLGRGRGAEGGRRRDPPRVRGRDVRRDRGHQRQRGAVPFLARR